MYRLVVVDNVHCTDCACVDFHIRTNTVVINIRPKHAVGYVLQSFPCNNPQTVLKQDFIAPQSRLNCQIKLIMIRIQQVFRDIVGYSQPYVKKTNPYPTGIICFSSLPTSNLQLLITWYMTGSRILIVRPLCHSFIIVPWRNYVYNY